MSQKRASFIYSGLSIGTVRSSVSVSLCLLQEVYSDDNEAEVWPWLLSHRAYRNTTIVFDLVTQPFRKSLVLKAIVGLEWLVDYGHGQIQ